MDSPPTHVLAIDLGTGGPKAAVVRSDGALAATAVRSVRTLRLPPSGAEQDPQELWSAVVDAAAAALAAAGTAAASVVGVVTTAQFSSIVPLDDALRPLTNLILWMDERGAPRTRDLLDRHAEATTVWVDLHGRAPFPTGGDSLSHMLFVRAERPHVYERTRVFLEPTDFLTARLTGEPSASPCTAFSMLLTDNLRPEEPRYHPRLVDLSGIGLDKLPPLVSANARVGAVRPEVAAALGLPRRTPVFSGSNDTQAASLAAGVAHSRNGGIHIGSTAQVLAGAPGKRTDLAAGLVSMPSPIPGGFLVLAEHGPSGRTLEHVLETVVRPPDGGEALADLEAALRSTTAGAGGVLFLPWLGGVGAPRPAPGLRGALLGLSLETGRREILRAVVEGVTVGLRWLLEAVERFVGRRLDSLHFSGGAALSASWAQIVADVVGRPVLRLADARFAGCRAAAFLAFSEIGLIDRDEPEWVCRVEREFLPQPPLRAVYDGLFVRFLEAVESHARLAIPSTGRPGS